VLRALREAAPAPLPQERALERWPDRAQRDRAILSLLADGLIESEDGLLRLPQ
jgi:A/G-specific adenine glycosylase